ncbi:cation:proton antiporter [Mesorhizobium sp. M00.F.Ca.ET.216.01.1.1]|uniref:cation:proton antiporter domain-containing protein n=1 Tax=Mesorhizobium sp. M00.F.Ca.ET.216.01.1.1 TaxID=2500528 RepID=UPI000FD98282|nr:cation:proton antiporter [Mesorhizobium sp. M00.F.Ca.ET.216.01.1.1]TGQ28289.1 potassium transporter TrkA [Mesorhizobium sp. M00.F.Ca.ET.216.01.1.1]
MTGAESFAGYKNLLLFLVTAGVVVPLFMRLRISPVLGFLTAGVVLGPFGLGALAQDVPWLSAISITDAEQIAGPAEFGVAFLLFMMGLELSWERLVRMHKLVFGLGLAQVVLSSIVLGLVAFVLGQTPVSAIILGASLALSSTALVLPSLAERKRLSSAVGRTSFAVLLFQDLAVAPLLISVALLDVRHGAVGLGALYAIIPAIASLGALIVLGRLVLRPLFKLVAATSSNELFLAACLLIVIGTGLVAVASGLSMSLGAFVAGLLLAETEYRRQVEVAIQPFQGLLLGLFFVAVGAGLDLTQLLDNPFPALGTACAFVAIKSLVLLPIGQGFGLSRHLAREVALILSPAGEFTLVVIGAAMAAGIVPARAGATAMIATTLSMFAIPIMVRISENLSSRGASEEASLAALAPNVTDRAERVIIAGYGRVGDLVGQMLTRHKATYLTVDNNAALVARERSRGAMIYYGDATQVELLRRCGITSARALVVTMDNAVAVEAVVAAARAERPDLVIVARARDPEHAAKLYGIGVTDAVPETTEASLQLSEALLVNIGVPAGTAIASIHEKRDEFRRMLQGPDKKGRERRGIRLSSRDGRTGRS